MAAAPAPVHRAIKTHAQSFGTKDASVVKMDYTADGVLVVERHNAPANVPPTATFRGRDEIEAFFRDLFGWAAGFKPSPPQFFVDTNVAVLRWSAKGISVGIDTFVVDAKSSLIAFQSVTIVHDSATSEL